jgi:hypothetical protein
MRKKEVKNQTELRRRKLSPLFSIPVVELFLEKNHSK